MPVRSARRARPRPAHQHDEDTHEHHDHEPAPAGPGLGVAPVPGLVHAEILRDGPVGPDPLGGTAVPEAITDTLIRRQGRGSALPDSMAQAAGAALGTDFSGVRLHTDGEADHLSRSMQAAAFTTGQDVYLTGGTATLGSSSGQKLLAHELVHVAQNAAGTHQGSGAGPTIGHAHDPAEAEADHLAGSVLTGLHQPGERAPGGTDTLRRQTLRPGAPAPVIRRGFLSDIWNGIASLFSGGSKEKEEGYPKVVKLGKGKSESVNVANKEEEREAADIIAELSTTYGIDLSSPGVIDGLKGQYPKVLAEEVAKLKTSTWEMKELRAVRSAVSKFAPILGKARETSTLADKAQGVTTIGRVEESINYNRADGKVEEGTMGEYFGGNKSVGLFDTVTDLSDSRYIAKGKSKKSNKTTLEANAIHEMAHGLIQPIELGNWISTLDFWTDRYTPSGKDGAEEPPTGYGKTGGAAEDLAESVAIYFINRPMLLKKAPKRTAFLDKMVKGWTPQKKEEVLEGATTATGTGE